MELVVEVCETPNHRLGGPMMVDHFSDIGPMAVKCGALRQGEMSTLVPDRSDHEGHMVDAEWDPQTRTYRYFSLPARGWVTVPKDDLLNWELDVEWFLRWIADQFGLTPSSLPRVLIKNHFWHLGTPWIGKRRCGLFFTRRLGFDDGYDQVTNVLRDRSGEYPGVLLTSSPWNFWNAKFPGNHRLIRLQDCLEESEEARFDMEAISRILAGVSGEIQNGPIHYSNDYSTVTANGNPFHFRGDKQKQVVGMLVQAWESGDAKLRTQVVLENVDSTAGTIKKFFSRHPDWQDLIGYGRGFCWIKV